MSSTSWDWPGARWWRCDLHVHSPESCDYSERSQVSFDDWAAGVFASEAQIVALTDHNSPRGVDAAKAALGARGYLFPGVELSVSPGVHVLALFETSAGRDEVAALLTRCALDVGDWGRPEAVSPRSVFTVLQEARKMGALCILAHVDAKKGLLREVKPGADLRRVLASGLAAAIEVKDVEPALCRYLDGSVAEYLPPSGPLTLLRSSDSHSPATIGSRSTWIKMGRPTLEGLRLALRDGPLSVRDPNTAPDPNQHAAAVLESLNVEDTRYIGRREPFTLRLNPWLNALIGGRGTGKSSLLELARAALRREGELDRLQTVRRDWDELIQVYRSRSSRGILTERSRVTVVYRKDGGRFRISWDPAGELRAIEAEQPDGSWAPSAGAVSERFPVRIYSQKQVFELTREPEALLRIVDEAPEVGYRAWEEAWSAATTRFLLLRSKIRQVESQLSAEPRVKGELEDVARKLEVFEAAGHTELLRRWQLRRRQRRAVEGWSESLDSLVSDLASAVEAVELDELDPSLFSPDDPSDTALLATTGGIEAEVLKLRWFARTLASRAAELRDRWRGERERSAWTRALQLVDGDYARLLDDLDAAGGEGPQSYGRLVQRRQVLEESQRDFEGARRTLKGLYEQDLALRRELRALRLRISTQRAAFLSSVLEGNPFVRIEVLPLGALASAGAELRSLWGREGQSFAKDIGAADEPGTLLGELVASYEEDLEGADEAAREASTGSLLDRLDALKERIRAIREGSEAANDKRFATFLQDRPPEQMDRLDAWFPGDTLRVSFRPAGRRAGFQPIGQGSPGQRSAALLAFLLSHGEEPILLDQPEDDLDNHLVYDLIVQQLRRIKGRRQVLVVTHNANIVVNGDAEYVVALDVVNGQTAEVCSGGLQQQDVRDEICRVLEGGAEAFQRRYRRIAERSGDV